MTNRKRYLMAVAGVLIVAVMAIPLYMAKQQTTFRAEVTDHMSMLDTLERLSIRKISSKEPNMEDHEITIKDSNEIRDMLRLLKDVELIKVQNVDVNLRNSNYYEWRLLVNKEGRSTEGFGITFYNERFISIYSERNTRAPFQDYKITNEFNLDEVERRLEGLKKEGGKGGG